LIGKIWKKRIRLNQQFKDNMKIKIIIKGLILTILAIIFFYHYSEMNNSIHQAEEYLTLTNSQFDSDILIMKSKIVTNRILEDIENSRSALFIESILIILFLSIEINWTSLSTPKRNSSLS
jgi:hypothetical protein